ncbi:o-succinylbenzoate synthase [Flexivirga caeni]|uniref:o-succinylbenzoate synthase n=1 Tax=Flexivirga caeni TaxID=2294115 RepID=A0A3M9M698_9MICO|nr:o-succinylbenzoate synthase [Flexivirga caeni]RNI21070.1 o-succinylbenzoate synthase [Flexivirga caeni]
MRLTRLTLHTVRLPLVAPFTTSFSTQTERTAIIFELTAAVEGREVTGWGECVALNEPLYSSEYVSGAIDVIRRFLMPRLDGELTAETVGQRLAPIVGHRMAKAALEMAVLDAQLRAAGTSFAAYLGVTRQRIPCGVSVGIQDSVAALLSAVGGYLDAGYLRVKLKIRPGWDIEPVRAVRKEFGPIPLQVDANAAYTLADAAHLRLLDEFGLLLIEQPLAEDDLRQHAALSQLLTTPMCLDESIVSAAVAASAISMGAAAVINVKPGRVGGYLEARRIHDLARAHGVAVWCGGMLESGIGRAANATLAALPGFTLVGDVSASDRFYRQDITPPIEMRGGHIDVPREPGLCTPPERRLLEKFTVETIEL